MRSARSAGMSEGQRTSLWERTASLPIPAPILAPMQTDVCVVGAGIAGLSVAYELALRGRQVLVLDDGPIGGGETGRTTAHVATSFDDYYHEVERLHGTEAMRRLAHSFRAGVDRIEQIVRKEAIDCDFVRLDGWWYAADDDGIESLRREADAVHRAGFAQVELTEHSPFTGVRAPLFLRFPGQAQFHPLRYLGGLVHALRRFDGLVLGDAHVVDVSDAGDDGWCRVKLSRDITVQAREVVVATNSPINDRVAMHTKQHAYRTYVVLLRVAREAVPLALLWDTLEPYHYVRRFADAAESDADVLIVGGEDHKTGQDDDEMRHFAALESWARMRFPVQDVVGQWSGQVLEPVDHVAFIGRNPGDRHVYIVTGDSGNGITHGAIAGMLVADLIQGVVNPWEALYDPRRRSLRALPTWLAENANVARQYADLVTPGEVAHLNEVPAGQGRIVRDGMHKLAVYRDDQGQVHLRSAVCPHLGCIVDWNAAERTWDCPCHGSRFATDGTVLNGPAVSPLAEANVQHERTPDA